MKTLIKSLLVACSFSLVSFSALQAAPTPIGRPVAVATYQTGIYATVGGKLNIALDKEVGGTVVVRFKNSAGRVLFDQQIGKREKAFRTRLDVSELPDGTYQVEITNGLTTSIHTVVLSTQQPSVTSRLVAIN